MTGAKLIAKTLKQYGVKRVFYYAGGTVVPLLNALLEEGIEYVAPRNEQGAGYAAVGAAKVSQELQVAIVTSGPGATNVLTPTADAYYDSVPLLVFTGQVAIQDINFDKKVRQKGFQETDTVNIFSSITKKAHILNHNDQISEVIWDACQTAVEGRPGPVLIDLPMDVQFADFSNQEVIEDEKDASNTGEKPSMIAPETLEDACRYLAQAERPLIFSGNGVQLADAVPELRELIERYKIPVIYSLPGIGSMPSDHPLCFGFPGHTGEFFANLALCHSDVVLSLGARFDLRQTGSKLDSFTENKTIIRVDIDNRELLHGRVKGDLNFNCDLKLFLTQFEKQLRNHDVNQYGTWVETINQWKKSYHSSQFYEDEKLYSYDIIRAVDSVTKDMQVVVSTGVGGHQQMVARYFTFNTPNRCWLTSAGHGTMGFDLPACNGAMFVSQKQALGIVFAGDGSFQMNIQELATVAEYQLPVKIFVLDNRKLGVVSQFQIANWKKDPGSGNKQNPSFAKIGEGYGLKSFEIKNKDEIEAVVREVFADQLPTIVHCHIDYSEETLPMLMGGQPMNQMHPFEKVEIPHL
jgi:acetolactate synthase I/II/III large subunit